MGIKSDSGLRVPGPPFSQWLVQPRASQDIKVKINHVLWSHSEALTIKPMRWHLIDKVTWLYKVLKSLSLNLKMNRGRKGFWELKEEIILKPQHGLKKNKIYCTGKTKGNPCEVFSWDEAMEISPFQLRIEGISLKAKGAFSLSLGPHDFFYFLANLTFESYSSDFWPSCGLEAWSSKKQNSFHCIA